MAYTSVYNGVGESGKPFKLSKANRNYTTRYFDATHASGDIRVGYDKMTWKGVGGGEVLRLIAAAGKAGAAAGATINAAHFTATVNSGATVSGALNALRLTIGSSVAAPGGTLAALQLASSLAANSTHSLNQSAFIRVSQDGSTDLGTFAIFPAAEADNHSADKLLVAGADKAATHYLRCVFGSTPFWLMGTTTAPAHS